MRASERQREIPRFKTARSILFFHNILVFLFLGRNEDWKQQGQNTSILNGFFSKFYFDI